MEKPHFFYKTKEHTLVGQNLQQFINDCDAASETARLWALAHGVEVYYESANGMAGGIAAVEFSDDKPHEGWECIAEYNEQKFFAPVADSDLEKEMYALPVVSEFKLIGILNFKHRTKSDGTPLPITFGDTTPRLFSLQGYWYVDVPYECQAQGLESIDVKDFNDACHIVSFLNLRNKNPQTENARQ